MSRVLGCYLAVSFVDFIVGVHYFSFYLNHLQYLFICFVLSPWYFHHTPPNLYCKCLKSSNICFLWSPCFASIQRNTVNKCFQHTFLQVKAEGSSHEVTFLIEILFFPKQFAFLLHDNFYSLRSPNSFQILSIDCDPHSSSFCCRHSHDFAYLKIICFFVNVLC